jgi:ABC-2 type transport system ATP-binding protein
MRAGRVLDAGTPAELVNRHARSATVWFTLPGPAGLLVDVITALNGVREVHRDGQRVTVRGDREIIARVGAALVQHGPVPADLGAQVPGLGDALLRLLEAGHGGGLDGAPDDEAAPAGPADAHHNLIGGRR